MGEHVIPSGFKVVFWNARSMKGKLVDIKECVYGTDLDVLCIEESWLNDGINNEEILWLGNTIYRLDREGDRAGGLIMYVKNEYANHVTMPPECNYIHDHIEVQTMLICRPMRRRKLILNVYRPPGVHRQSFIDKIETILDKFDVDNIDVYIGGDFNIDFGKPDDDKFSEMETFLNSNNYKPLIDTITRPESSTIIDNILSNVEDIIYHEVLPDLISDHLPVVCVQKGLHMGFFLIAGL